MSVTSKLISWFLMECYFEISSGSIYIYSDEKYVVRLGLKDKQTSTSTKISSNVKVLHVQRRFPILLDHT